jgi:hypothetical protein
MVFRALRARATSVHATGDAGALWALYTRSTHDGVEVCPDHREEFKAIQQRLLDAVDNLSTF